MSQLLLMLRHFFAACSTCVLVLVVLILGQAQQSSAADPEFVGRLAKVMNSSILPKLQLTDEVKAQLKKIVDERETGALDLALKLAKATPEEKEKSSGSLSRRIREARSGTADSRTTQVIRASRMGSARTAVVC